MKGLTALELVREDLAQVEAKMHQTAEDAYAPLGQAFTMLLESGGKRLRPAMAILAARFHPCDQNKLTSLAAALETLHTATLVHDDVIDGSLLRRGHPTLNASWNQGATVLAGDYLFARAAGFAAETEDVRVIQLFSQTLMTICDGELRQLFAMQRWEQPKEEYYRRIYAKTASLFAAATESGAVLSEAPEPEIIALRDYGRYFGMAFQIVDDILDFVGDEKVMGKPAGSDLRQGTVTLPVFYFMRDNPHADQLRQILKRITHRGEDGAHAAAEAVSLIRNSDAIEAARREALDFVAQAKESLTILPNTPYRAALAELADHVVHRSL